MGGGRSQNTYVTDSQWLIGSRLAYYRRWYQEVSRLCAFRLMINLHAASIGLERSKPSAYIPIGQSVTRLLLALQYGLFDITISCWIMSFVLL